MAGLAVPGPWETSAPAGDPDLGRRAAALLQDGDPDGAKLSLQVDGREICSNKPAFLWTICYHDDKNPKLEKTVTILSSQRFAFDTQPKILDWAS